MKCSDRGLVQRFNDDDAILLTGVQPMSLSRAVKAAVSLACAGAMFVPAVGRSQSGDAWHRSSMHQGHYDASVLNASRAQLRVLCAPAEDSDKANVESLTYVPIRSVRERDQVPATISIDGSSRKLVLKVEKTDADERTVIRLGSDDLDSLEQLKLLVSELRKGSRLTIGVPALDVHDMFSLRNADRALGRCE
jgi:hypothetical protein